MARHRQRTDTEEEGRGRKGYDEEGDGPYWGRIERLTNRGFGFVSLQGEADLDPDAVPPPEYRAKEYKPSGGANGPPEYFLHLSAFANGEHDFAKLQVWDVIKFWGGRTHKGLRVTKGELPPDKHN
jgi:hypothetical protein